MRLIAAANEVTLERVALERVANLGCRHLFNPQWERVFRLALNDRVKLRRSDEEQFHVAAS